MSRVTASGYRVSFRGDETLLVMAQLGRVSSMFEMQLREGKKRTGERGRERLDLSPAFSRHRGGPGLSRLKHLGFREGRVVWTPIRTSDLETEGVTEHLTELAGDFHQPP